jgi:hypothetical protein
MKQAGLPIDTWMVIEPEPHGRVRVLSTHETQGEAEAERDKRNRGLRAPRYSAVMALEPVAERMAPRRY